ncbi:MAG TPA: LysR substrate-binding domain-containing protein, partial [Stellaceae bacterium]|nr:LysR substrate-binding domain-containing protein [Stellaceae bacterium]
HECLLFRDPATGRPFPWEFRKGKETIAVKVTGRLVLNDLATKLAACAAGLGIAQSFALGIDPMLDSGALVQLLPDWAEERFPLYVYHPSRHLPPAKVRAFIAFVETQVLAGSRNAGAAAPGYAVKPRAKTEDKRLAKAAGSGRVSPSKIRA